MDSPDFCKHSAKESAEDRSSLKIALDGFYALLLLSAETRTLPNTTRHKAMIERALMKAGGCWNGVLWVLPSLNYTLCFHMNLHSMTMERKA